jgi:hypothetical protein
MTVQCQSAITEARINFTIQGEESVLLFAEDQHFGKRISLHYGTARRIYLRGSWVLDSVHLSGRIVQTDGTLSPVVSNSTAYVRRYGAKVGTWSDDTPASVREFVEGWDPTGFRPE